MRFLTGALLLGFLAVSARATTIDDLCAPADDPCVVSGTHVIDPDSTLDLAGRALTLAEGAKVTFSSNLTVTNATTCSFQEGSKLTESVASPAGNFLELDCTAATFAGAITTRGAGVLVEGDFNTGMDGPYVVSGSIKARGDQVGVLAIDSYGNPGGITVTGKIEAKSKLGTPPGEFRLITNFGNLLVSEKAKIKMQGATADPFTEFFIVEAGSGTLTIDGTIDARCKSGAYAMNLEGNDAVSFGPKSKIKATARNTGVEMAINSQISTVTLGGKIQAAAKDVSNPNGPKVHVCAGDDIYMQEKSSIDASAGFEGSVILGAFDIARVQAGAAISSKSDGDIEVCGGTSGSISSSARVTPDPESVGTWSGAGCLSPESQVIFDLDCNGAPP